MENLFQFMAERERVVDSQPQPGEFALVSIITINYNQAEITRQFLESAGQLTYPNYELIVVDNASAQPLSETLDVSQYPCLRLIRSAVNLGFTGGNNLGMQEAKGDYFLIVNNDTELPPTLIQELLKPFRQDKRVGVTCPKIRFFDAPHLLQYAGYNPINVYTGQVTPIGLNQQDDGRFDQPHTTYFAHGCAMMVSRKVVEQRWPVCRAFFPVLRRTRLVAANPGCGLPDLLPAIGYHSA